MQEPEQYIFDEWDSMCAKANKSLHSDCPLLEDEVLVEMHKYVSSFGFWFNKETHPPKREAGQKILVYGGYVFGAECDEDGDWCSIGGDDFTHWMPYFEPPHHT